MSFLKMFENQVKSLIRFTISQISWFQELGKSNFLLEIIIDEKAGYRSATNWGMSLKRNRAFTNAKNASKKSSKSKIDTNPSALSRKIIVHPAIGYWQNKSKLWPLLSLKLIEMRLIQKSSMNIHAVNAVRIGLLESDSYTRKIKQISAKTVLTLGSVKSILFILKQLILNSKKKVW